MLRSRRGSVAVELALGAVPLVVITVAALDWGWYFSRQLQVTNIARDAALAACTAKPDEDPVTIAETRATASLATTDFESTDVTVAAVITTDANVDGNIIQVDVQVQWTPIAGLLPLPAVLRSTSSFALMHQ